MYLCLDIGNTTIGVAVVCNDEIKRDFRITTDHTKSVDEYYELLKNNIDEPFDDVIVSSVVPSLNKIITKLFSRYYQITPFFVTPKTKTGINIKIDNPDELGADLLVDAVGAHYHNNGNNMIVDLGTANKFLVVLGNNFMGGAIAPGLKTSLKTLFKDAELLDSVTLEAPGKTVGSSTIECIRSGAIVGTAAQIEGMLERMEKEVGPLHLIITGGIARKIISEVKVEFEYCPNLIFEGLIQIYKLNH